MKRIIYFLIFSAICNFIFGQDTVVHWLNFEQTKQQFEKKQKPILIFIYDTSALSQRMLEKTFGNPEVVKYLNILFYPVKLKSDTSGTITFFSGEKFPPLKNKPYHSLVYALLGDSLSFPSMVIFSPQAQGRVFYGFRDRDHIFPVLVYYAEKVYVSTDYNAYEKYYLKAYPPGRKQIITRLNIHWLTMEEALEKQKKQPRKIFIDFYNNYNVSQTIMRVQVYNNPVIADYLNKHFYPVTLNARSEEVFSFKGKEYKNAGKPYNFHEFVLETLGGNMFFPAFAIFDENLNLLEKVQVFLTPKYLEPLLHYYGDNAYKKEKYDKFVKTYHSSFIEE